MNRESWEKLKEGCSPLQMPSDSCLLGWVPGPMCKQPYLGLLSLWAELLGGVCQPSWGVRMGSGGLVALRGKGLVGQGCCVAGASPTASLSLATLARDWCSLPSWRMP